MHKKIYIIIDTNRLGYYKGGFLECNNFKYLAISKELFQSLITFIQSNRLDSIVKIVIPRLVFDELKIHQQEQYYRQIDKLKNVFHSFNEIPNFQLSIPMINYSNYLEEKIDGFISKYNIIKIDYPKDAVLQKLIRKVLNIEKPFGGKNKKDAGFKDALIWESIVEFAHKNNDGDFVFLTNDDDFIDANLTDEFKKITNRRIDLINELSNLKNLLDKKLKLKLDLDFLVRSFSDMFTNKLYILLNEYFSLIIINNNPYRIIEIINDFKLIDIFSLGDDKFQLMILFAVKHETPHTDYAMFDDFYNNYESDVTDGFILLQVKKISTKKFQLYGFDFLRINLGEIPPLPPTVFP